MNKFKLETNYKPKADQIKAIDALVEGIIQNKQDQVLLGVTGSGKTFTIANVIERVNKPTIVFAHNKTLAGQLYSEFKQLFPSNRVEYFVSNFDYYQPEAYMPKTDTYIEKTASTNQELDMLRMSAYNSMLERKDTIVVASVACIYASSNPKSYEGMIVTIKTGEEYKRSEFIQKLVQLQYKRNDISQIRGSFKVTGESIEICPGHTDQFLVRVEYFDDEIERIVEIDPVTKKVLKGYTLYNFFPAEAYARDTDDMKLACEGIEQELKQRLEYFQQEGKHLEYERLSQRTYYDLESLRNFGYCSGIENYSMHIDGRKPGDRPFNLFDYFKDDFLLVIDESHVSLPQISGMFNGDRARKTTLVEYGFRLPSALENRPMTFQEFETIDCQRIYVSATPGDYELEKVDHHVIEQIIRPTGLLDPLIDVRKTEHQLDDLMDEIIIQNKKNHRTIVTTTTIKMAEDLSSFLRKNSTKVAYIHHETKTLERIEILLDLRKGKYDVLVGVNLLREGLDLPEVSLVAILGADHEGFLRSYRSLIQTIGRAARNAEGRVIMYADRITDSMDKAIQETKRRRTIQEKYNQKHGIVPQTIQKTISEAIHSKETKAMAMKFNKNRNKEDRAKLIEQLRTEMHEAAKNLDFERAMELRDIIIELESEGK